MTIRQPHRIRQQTLLPPPPRTKQVIEWLFKSITLPRWWSYRIFKKLLGSERSITWASESISKKPGPLGVLYRAAFYRRLLHHVGQDVSIGFGTCFSKSQAQLGDRVYIGRYCSIGQVVIADETKIADGAQLLSGKHHHISKNEQVTFKRITIGPRVWIGANAVVMANVGEDAIVAAGAVVTQSVPPGITVAGVPAKPIRQGQAPLASPIPKPLPQPLPHPIPFPETETETESKTQTKNTKSHEASHQLATT